MTTQNHLKQSNLGKSLDPNVYGNETPVFGLISSMHIFLELINRKYFSGAESLYEEHFLLVTTFHCIPEKCLRIEVIDNLVL